MNYTHAFSGFAVRDIAAAKAFYQKLGLTVADRQEGLELKLPSQSGSVVSVFVYPSPQMTAPSYTILNLEVLEIDTVVDELIVAGIVFEQYDMAPYIKTDEKGISRNDSSMGPKAMAWCKDPSGNIVSILQSA